MGNAAVMNQFAESALYWKNINSVFNFREADGEQKMNEAGIKWCELFKVDGLAKFVCRSYIDNLILSTSKKTSIILYWGSRIIDLQINKHVMLRQLETVLVNRQAKEEDFKAIKIRFLYFRLSTINPFCFGHISRKISKVIYDQHINVVCVNMQYMYIQEKEGKVF